MKRDEIDMIKAVYSVIGLMKNERIKKAIDLEILNKRVSFQMDSGATVSVIDTNTFPTKTVFFRTRS